MASVLITGLLLFDICVLPGVKNPLTLGPQSDDIAGFITIDSRPGQLNLTNNQRTVADHFAQHAATLHGGR